jgi:hypothetical protein
MNPWLLDKHIKLPYWAQPIGKPVEHQLVPTLATFLLSLLLGQAQAQHTQWGNAYYQTQLLQQQDT